MLARLTLCWMCEAQWIHFWWRIALYKNNLLLLSFSFLLDFCSVLWRRRRGRRWWWWWWWWWFTKPLNVCITGRKVSLNTTSDHAQYFINDLGVNVKAGTLIFDLTSTQDAIIKLAQKQVRLWIIYVRVCVFVYVCVCVRVRLFVSVCVRVCMCVCVRVALFPLLLFCVEFCSDFFKSSDRTKCSFTVVH